MRLLETFFALNPVFTFDEAEHYLSERKGPRSPVAELLHYHHKTGRILLVRRGLYYVVPAGTQIATCPVDPYLVVSKMASDAVLCYHSALEAHGVAHTVWSSFFYLTKNHAKGPFTFRECSYQAVSIPTPLVKTKQTNIEVKQIDRMGVKIAVTTLERTLVDAMDRPHLVGGWEEIWKSFESLEYLDLEKIIEYAVLLNNRLTIAKVGYFLDMHREQFRVAEEHLEKLHRYQPKQPRYLERSPKGPQKLIPAWNLIIPQALHNLDWEEPHGDL